jgi:hypothetical protein
MIPYLIHYLRVKKKPTEEQRALRNTKERKGAILRP